MITENINLKLREISCNNNSQCNRPLRACQPTAGLTSTCLHTEVNDNPASLVVICGQHFESCSPCWLSRSDLLPQINQIKSNL